jgi:hypothetical protein
MPPELVALGDQLEAAATRAITRRRTRRQQIMNAAASLIIAVPVTITVATTQFTTQTVPVSTVTPTPTAQQVTHDDLIAGADDGPNTVADDYLPRDLRRYRLRPQSEFLRLPRTIPRPALR